MPGSTVALTLRRFLNYPQVIKCKNVVNSLFGRYLLVTNVGLSAGFSFTGDLIVQQYEISQGRKRQLDTIRSSQVTISGGVVRNPKKTFCWKFKYPFQVGAVCHYWYIFLDARIPGRTLKSVAAKVFVDQIVCSPLYLSCFLATTCYLEQKTWSEFKTEFVQKGWRLYLADCAVWPPAQMINFYVLPLRFRVLFDNTVSLGFDVYTSYVKYEIPLD